MSRAYKFRNAEGLYFVTFATVGWIDVFTREVYKNPRSRKCSAKRPTLTAQAQDYLPFGMLMPGRKYENVGMKYRYAFNGMELQNEQYTGAYDFGARIQDSRIGGRFLSVDPRYREYPYLSPYIFAANNPIYYIDENGEGPGAALKKFLKNAFSELVKDFTVEYLKSDGKDIDAIRETFRENINYKKIITESAIKALPELGNPLSDYKIAFDLSAGFIKSLQEADIYIIAKTDKKQISLFELFNGENDDKFKSIAINLIFNPHWAKFTAISTITTISGSTVRGGTSLVDKYP